MSRYELRSIYAEQGGVTTHEGVDPLTGLPVLIYRFKGFHGKPANNLRKLESENIPGILDINFEDDQGEVVVAYSKDYSALALPLNIDIKVILLDSTRALKDAAQAGVVHSDIRPERFLASQNHVLLEGFGIPWPKEDNTYQAPEASQRQSFAGDVYAWAKSMLELTKNNLPSELQIVLNPCLDKNPDNRPSASELYDDLFTLEFSAVSAKSQEPDSLNIDLGSMTLPETPEEAGGELSLEIDFTPSAEESSQRQPLTTNNAEFSIPVSPLPEEPPLQNDTDPDPMLVLSDPGPKQPPPSPPPSPPVQKSSPPTFVKNLPPGATYRAGDNENPTLAPSSFEDVVINADISERPREWRSIIRVLLVLGVAGALAMLAFLQQQQGLRNFSPSESGNATSYIVQLTIGPRTLPPIDLYIIASPTGSRTPPGSNFGRYPPGQRQIALDKAGTWQLQGRFQDRFSDIVTLELPQERNAVITIPEPQPPEEEVNE